MKIKSTIIYYIKSFTTLLLKTNWWIALELFFFKPQLLKIRGEKFQFFVDNLMDIWTIKEVIIDDCYEIRHTSRLDVVFDIGTGVGDFSVILSKNAGKILTYDPDENRAKLSARNIKHNRCRNVFFQKKFITSLSEIFQEEKVQTCDLLKIDCEGAEYDIFEKTSDDFLRKIKKIVGEIHLFNENMKIKYADLKMRLTMLGFALKEKENPVHSNILFIFAERKISPQTL